MTLALVLDCNGFPIRSQVYEGNVSESKTLSEMINDLQRTGLPKEKQPTVIMDAGIATEENITWLKEHKYNYLVVSRKRHREFDESQSVIVNRMQEAPLRHRKSMITILRKPCYTATPANVKKRNDPLRNFFAHGLRMLFDSSTKDLGSKGG